MGLEEGLDVSEYVRQGMDPEQIRAILQGYRTDIDYTLYAKPWYTAGEMREIGSKLIREAVLNRAEETPGVGGIFKSIKNNRCPTAIWTPAFFILLGRG